ncbi:MAG: HI0074 family nucleotidyltransferase substrate-binding subunit [Acidobacteria bacterium]|nr:HI0074 family nucleotidyltransferase substrate-binding subunit [Acidobacteriota bacterium]
MTLDLTSFESALGQLDTSAGYLESDLARQDPGLREQFRSAVIQAFEFSYTLAVKFIRRQLEQIVANPHELSEMAFMDLIRAAADAGLVPDVPRFRVYREKRNLTSHTYDAEKAEDVLSVIPEFRADMKHLLDRLRSRNHGHAD